MLASASGEVRRSTLIPIVPSERLELSRPHGHQILNLARLPIPPRGHYLFQNSRTEHREILTVIRSITGGPTYLQNCFDETCGSSILSGRPSEYQSTLRTGPASHLGAYFRRSLLHLPRIGVWAGEDSNLRTPKGLDLQSSAFDHSATDPKSLILA